MSNRIHYFAGERRTLFLTEFGYSAPQCPTTIGPRIRDTHLLHYVLQGECRFCGESVGAGEAFLIAPGALHDFSVGSGYRHYWLAFGGRTAVELLAYFTLPALTHAVCRVENPAFVREVLAAAFLACQAGEHPERPAQSALLALLPLLTQRNAGRPDGPPFVETAARYIQANYDRRVTMAEVAGYLHLSEKYLCRCFKEELGMPPQKYLLRIRMERARTLLLETSLQVGEIARSVGYLSPLTFSDIFRGYWGQCPTAFRQTQKKDEVYPDAEGKQTR